MIVLVVLISLSLCPRGAISVASLKHFETLSHVAVNSRIKRGADGTRDLFTQVRFHAFNRDFDVTLKSGTHLLAKDFQARLVHQDGSSSILYLDESLIFSGHLTDQPTVRVHAHIEDTLWSIQVFELTDIYAVEPAWRLLTPSENPRNDTLIAYRASDLTSNSFNSSQFCGVHDHETVDRQPLRVHRPTPEPVLPDIPGYHSYSTGSRRREKRLSDSESVCKLFIVGDYTFFKGRCKANHKACLALMVANVQMADSIFETTEFVGKDYKVISVGLEVAQMVLYSSYSLSTEKSTPRHFNEKLDWTAGAKLDAFAVFTSYMTYRKDICASHLFTDYPFPARVLGLAWMLSICSKTPPGAIKRNSGLTSGTESTEGPIPSLQMNLVFAHDLLSADGGTLFTDKKEILQRWAEYFSNILTATSSIDDEAFNFLPLVPTNDTLDDLPTIAEVNKAIKQRSSGKAPGPGSIPTEIYKAPGPDFIPSEIYKAPGPDSIPSEIYKAPGPDSIPSEIYKAPGPDSIPAEIYKAPGPDSIPAEIYKAPGPDSIPSEIYKAPGPDSIPAEIYKAPGPDSIPAEIYKAPGPDSNPTEIYKAPGPDSIPSEIYKAPSPDSIPAEIYKAPGPDSIPSEIYKAPGPDSIPSEIYKAPGPDSIPAEIYKAPGPDSIPSEIYKAPGPDSIPSEIYKAPGPDSIPSEIYKAPGPDSIPSEIYKAPGPDSIPAEIYKAPGPDSIPSEIYKAPGPDSNPAEIYKAPGPDSIPSEIYKAPGPDSNPAEIYKAPGPDSIPSEIYKAPGPDSIPAEIYKAPGPDSIPSEIYKPPGPDSIPSEIYKAPGPDSIPAEIYKAPGSDSIPSEIYKAGGPVLTEQLHQFFTNIWVNETMPQDFKDASIVHLYKRKGNRQSFDNTEASPCSQLQDIAVNNSIFQLIIDVFGKITLSSLPLLSERPAHIPRHNFGSQHDNKTRECSAPDSMGGNFIMWSRSVSGKNANNVKFSPCSRRQMSECLASVTCLTRKSAVVNFCGNGIVGGTEQCDAGAAGFIDTDRCCTNDCRLRGQAMCSDLNQACCKNCSMSSAGTLCIAKDLIECEEASYCTGQGYDCPDPTHMADWTNCKDRGQCYRGICRSFCEAVSIKHGLKLKGCLCQTNEHGAACKWCCFDASDPDLPGPCVVHSNDTVHDGRPCYLGHCQKGVCESQTESTIRRLIHYLPPSSSSKLGKFMRTNIVASVICLSLIVWLPAVIFLHVKDKRELRLKPALAIEYETDLHKHRTSEYRARKQRKRRRREAKEAAMSRDINDRRKSLPFFLIHELSVKKSPVHDSRSPEEKYKRNTSPRSPQFLQ